MTFSLWAKFTRWCCGSDKNPYHYTHHAVLLIGSMAYLYCAIFNYVFEFAHIINIGIQFALFPGIIWIWYRSRWKDDFQRMALVFMLVVTIISLPSNWLGNGGMSGPTFMLNICALMYISVAFHDLGGYRRLGQALSIFTPIPLLIFETYFPERIYYHPDDASRNLDMMFSFIITGIFIVLMMNNYSKRFMLEHMKSKNLAEQLRDLSESDPLTGLNNRRVFESQFGVWQANKAQFCLAILDLDHFKSINDTWGHTYGDEVLKRFSSLLKPCVRFDQCVAIRLGGEEFVLLIPKPIAAAEQLIDNLRLRLSTEGLPKGPVTFSAGLVQYHIGESRDTLLKRADDSLYTAKAAGRNCTVKDGDEGQEQPQELAQYKESDVLAIP